MNAPVFMSWLDRLPEVGAPILNERDRLEAMLAEAEAFERRAAELRASARAGRAGLLGKVAKLWSLYEIQRAGDAEEARWPVGVGALRQGVGGIRFGGRPLTALGIGVPSSPGPTSRGEEE